jgi:hypothetical protein
MVMGICAILIVSVFAWAVTEVIHHGSIFAELRAWAEVDESRVAELVQCPFCLSHWASALGTILVAVASKWDASISTAALMVLVWFCGTRLSNVLNDVCRPFKRLSKDSESGGP